LVGNIQVTGPLEVGAAAVIRGQVVAATIAIARGAVLEGQTRVTSGKDVHVFEEKRASRLEPGID
jgi:cytoskeletal protein CcmA (bactofilin family)